MQKRLILEVCQGRFKCKKAAITPGERLRVGRTDRADFVLPDDGKLSGVHFELQWDGKVAQLRDRNSQTGTLLDGERVEQAAVAHGSWIRAGQSDFSVYYEAYTPARADATQAESGEDPEELALARKQALAQLREEGGERRLYAVLDAARSGRILELVRESVEVYQSLYEGVEGEKLAHAAPYLVALPASSQLLAALVEEGWGRRWGIYLTSRRPFAEVRRHLRRFLMIQLQQDGAPAAEAVYFRYYDPRVMAVLCESITARQHRDLMAELEAIIFEGKGGATVRVEASEP